MDNVEKAPPIPGGAANKFIVEFAEATTLERCGDDKDAQEACWMRHRVYNDPKTAQAQVAKIKRENTTLKVRMRAVEDGLSWQEREQWRFNNGIYRRGIVHNFVAVRNTHYLHESLDRPGMLAYTPDARWGEQDRQKRVLPSVYLRAHHKGLEFRHFRQILSHYGEQLTPPAVLVAKTAEDIVIVYRKADGGPTNSCMTHDISRLPTDGINPVSVYANGGFELVYTATEDGTVLARAIVHPESQSWVRIYGYPQDQAELSRELEKLGYRQRHFTGRVFRYSEASRPCSYCGTRIIMPYLDGLQTLIVDQSAKTATVTDDWNKATHATLSPDGLAHLLQCRAIRPALARGEENCTLAQSGLFKFGG